MIGSVTFHVCEFLAKSTAQSYFVVKKPIVADIDGMPEPKVNVVWNHRGEHADAFAAPAEDAAALAPAGCEFGRHKTRRQEEQQSAEQEEGN